MPTGGVFVPPWIWVQIQETAAKHVDCCCAACRAAAGGIDFPVSVAMPDGVVTVDTWNEPENYCLTYAVSRAL